jgi:uncharacterized protein (DUF2225 family)
LLAIAGLCVPIASPGNSVAIACDTVLFVSDVVRNLLSQKKQIAVSFNQLKKESFSRSIFSVEFSESDSQNGRELKQKKFSRLKLCRHRCETIHNEALASLECCI